jgi:hypothetical protein
MPSVLFPSNLKAWRYRKAFQITEQAGQNLTDYQKLIKIGESSGATGCDFHLEGLSSIFPSGKNQGGDLRITDSDKTTLLSFWVENVTGTSPNRIAYVWVKIPSLSANQTKTLYCYFGNSAATNASNGDNTFLFFDDFEGSSLNPNKWTVDDDATISYSVANSLLTINGTSSYAYHEERYRATGYPVTSNVAVQARFRTTTPTQTKGKIFIGIYKNANNFLRWGLRKWGDPYINAIGTWTEKINGTYNYAVLDDTDLDTNFRIYTQKYIYSSGLNYFDIDYVNKGSRTNSGIANATTNAYICPVIDTGTWNFEVDWFFISKYVSPEPAFSSAGALEKRSSIIPLIFIR